MPTIREIRKSKGWTQTDLANKSGLNLMTISSMERGNPVQRTTLALVAMALEVQPEEITGVTVYNPPKIGVA